MSFSAQDFINIANDLSAQAAGWYRGITGQPVVVPASNPQIAAQQQVAIQQQQQAALLQANPTLAGVLANPTIILVLAGLLVVLLILAFRK